MGLIGESADVLKKIALMGFIVSAMVAVGTTISYVLPWYYLGYVFAFVRQEVLVFDFIIDTQALLFLVALSFAVESTVWGIKGLLAVINFTGWNN